MRTRYPRRITRRSIRYDIWRSTEYQHLGYSTQLYIYLTDFPLMDPYPIIYMSVYIYPHHVLRIHMYLLITMYMLYLATLYQFQDSHACNIS